MKKHVLVALTAFFIAMRGHAEPTLLGASGPGDTVTIGVEVAPGELPGTAKLSSGGATCTGTLIDDDIIITAAHCVLNKKGKLKFSLTYSFGETSKGDNGYSNTMFLSKKNTVAHPESYTFESSKIKFIPAHDLAIVRLPVPVPSAENRKVALATSAKSKWKYVIAGWGLQLPDEGGSISSDRKLMVTSELTVVQIGSATKPYILHGSIKSTKTGMNVSVAGCHGDSGGPTNRVRSLGSMKDIASIELIAVTTAYRPSSNLPNELKPPPEELSEIQQVQRCAFPGSVSLSASVPGHIGWIKASISALRAN